MKIEVPEGKTQVTLPNGMTIQIPEGSKYINVPDELLNKDVKDIPTKEKNEFIYEEGVPPKRVSEKVEDKKEDDVLIGGIETGLAVGTGMTTGLAANIYGTLKGIGKRITNAIKSGGEKDPYAAAKMVEEEAQKFAKKFTYTPQTETGKKYTEATTKALGALEPITPLGAEIGATTRAITGGIPRSPKVETPKVENATLEGIATMSVKASQGNKKAKTDLAKEVKLNPEAVDAADRLGIELPVDILGDNQLIKQTVGLVRSQVGSDDAVNFANLIDNAITKADEAFATFEQSDLATMSGKVIDNFNNSIKNLQKQSEAIYNKVTNTIPKNTEIELSNTQKVVAEYLDDLGVVPDAKGNYNLSILTPEEKKLFSLVSRQDKNISNPVLKDIDLDLKEFSKKEKQTMDYATSFMTIQTLTREEFGKLGIIARKDKQGKPLSFDEKKLKEQHIEYFDENIDDLLISTKDDFVPTSLETGKLNLYKKEIIEARKYITTGNEKYKKSYDAYIKAKNDYAMENSQGTIGYTPEAPMKSKVTFGALERERRAIGEALGKMPSGMYLNADKSLLKKMYAALKKDQLDNVESILGKDARDQLHLADRTFQKKIALEERAAELFGKQGEKSVAGLLRRSMTQGSKGDISALNKILKNVPKELHSEVIGSALGDIVTSRNGRFNFNDYVKLYQGLRKNAPVYNQVIKTLGAEHDKLLRDLYVVSKRLVEAKNKIIHTGKANQQILKQMQEEALLQRVIKFTIEKGVQKVTLGGISPKIDGLFKSGKDKMKAVGDLFNSEEFKELAISAINDIPSGKQVTKLAKSKAFRNWVKATGKSIKDPEAWILASFTEEKEENKK